MIRIYALAVISIFGALGFTGLSANTSRSGSQLCWIDLGCALAAALMVTVWRLNQRKVTLPLFLLLVGFGLSGVLGFYSGYALWYVLLHLAFAVWTLGLILTKRALPSFAS